MRRSRHSAVTMPTLTALTRPPEAAAVMARLCPDEATREPGTARKVDEVDTTTSLAMRCLSKRGVILWLLWSDF